MAEHSTFNRVVASSNLVKAISAKNGDIISVSGIYSTYISDGVEYATLKDAEVIVIEKEKNN